MNKDELAAILKEETDANAKLESIWKLFDGKYIPIHRFNEVNEEKKNALSTIKERDEQLEELKKGAGKESELQNKISELISENETAKNKYDSELASIKLNNAVDVALVGAKVRDVKAVKPFLDFDAIKIDGKNVLGLNDQIETLKKEKEFLFEKSNPDGFTGYEGGQNQNHNAEPPKPKTISQALAEKFKTN